MARHLKLRDNTDAAIMGVGHELANLSLCVILPVGPCFLQPGKTLALDAETLVVIQVPVQDIHLHRCHSIEVALEHVQRNEVTADINEQTTPGKPGPILNRHDGNSKSVCGGFHKLKEGLKAMEDTQRIGCCELRTRLADCQLIGFILTEFLHSLSTLSSMDQQSRTGGVDQFLLEGHSRLARKLGNKSVYSALQRCILKTRDRNGKRLINRQPSHARLNRGRHGHEVEPVLGLSHGMRCKKQ